MKRIRHSGELLWLLGIIFVAFGVSVCSKADLGVSMIAAPAFVLNEAIAPHLPIFSVGVAEYMIQGALLVLLCIVIRRFDWRYLLAFAVAVIYGYTLDLFLFLTGGLTVSSIPLRFLLLLVGDCFTAFGVACFFRTYMPLEVYELFVAEISAVFRIDINKVKWTFDLSLLALSVVLALLLFDVTGFDWSTIGYQSYHSIGPGTLITTLINSPIIALMSRLLGRIFDPTPRFPRLASAIGRKLD